MSRFFGHYGDLVGLHCRAYSCDQLLDDLVLALDDFVVAEAGIVGINAVMVAILGIVVNLGAVEQGLGGNASLVQANSTEALALEQHYVEAFGTGPLGSHIAARTSADNS